MEEESFFEEIVEEIFNELKIKYIKLSFGWLYKLEKDGKIKYIKKNRLSLNETIPSEIVSDKYATYEVLSSSNVPVIEHEMIFNPQKRNSYIEENISEKIISTFNKFNKIVVVKQNDGNSGKNVYKCKSLKEVETAIQKIFEDKTCLSICPYYEIDTEYRIVYLDGECLLVFGKVKPSVIGNGKDTLKELMKKNKMESVLNRKSFKKLESIPKKDEIIEISWKHNLCEGAKVKIVTDDKLLERIKKIAKDAAKAINIKFATVDIAHLKNDELKVLEINESVCLTKFKDQIEDGRKIVKDIYIKAILKMFEYKDKI